ncbi:chaperone NapD [Sinorhizobium alkalisoli]|uniref:chaperone NapD n=1 Tax=Sinorhizobium alkalisoli TaxID=1752398 RepID=UPI00124EA6A4|nr:chaperone NapD [Sinorhizobium alkalisoli]MCA1491332.1 chaperone NapD [Ensifer sp. NBAIM29]QFI70373.1 Periplasmic nitrate reductase component NapD [Sinorhizobium alkalisoli]
MPDAKAQCHISSAVIAAVPAKLDGVLAALAQMETVEVYGHQGGKIVVVIEGTSSGMLGECLSRISGLDGVVAASMVFEHVDAGHG